MQTVSILIGVSGSGKTRYTNTLDDSVVILRSDDIRLELFGGLDRQAKEDHAKVFKLLHERLEENIRLGNDVVLDATNLSRRKRIHLYNNIIKRINENIHVKGIVFVEPLSVILENNRRKAEENRVPRRVINKMYPSLNVPRIGADVDSIEVFGQTNFFKDKVALHEIIKLNTVHDFLDLLDPLYLDEIYENIIGPHDTPYHLEDIDEHITLTMENSRHIGYILFLVSIFHDLGKAVTKDGGTYYGHQNVSAYYALKGLNEIDGLNQEEINLILEVIYQHMNGHDRNLGKLNIRRNNLDEETIDFIRRFALIDDDSRIIDPDFTQNNGRK